MQPSILESGIVYLNPKPYLRAIHAWHPSLVLLDGNELICTFDLGQAVESLDYRTWLVRSKDGGHHWSEPVPLVEDPVQPSSHTLRTSVMRDGRLVAMGTRFHRDDPEEGLVNRANHGFVPMDIIMALSRDRGATWNGPRIVAPPFTGPGFEVCHPVVELQDGRWLWPTSTLAGWDGSAPNGIKCAAFISRDSGLTWPESIDLFKDPSGATAFWEISLAQLGDGRIVCVVWTLDQKSGAALPSLYSISNDGKTFLTPQPTGFLAQTAKIHALDSNRLFCAYRRDDKPGLWARIVSIEGARWVNGPEVSLWEGAVSGMTGMHKTNELSDLRFGYPSMVSLSQTEVFLVFWCREDAIHNIRWIRIEHS